MASVGLARFMPLLHRPEIGAGPLATLKPTLDEHSSTGRSEQDGDDDERLDEDSQGDAHAVGST